MRPDLRLAGFAVALWLAALACLYLPARHGLLLGGCAFVGVVITLLIARSFPRFDDGAFRWLVAGVLLGAGCGAVATAARVSVREAGPLAALVAEGATVTVELVVRDDPRALRGSPGLPPTYLLAVELRAVDPGDAPGLRLSARGVGRSLPLRGSVFGRPGRLRPWSRRARPSALSWWCAMIRGRCGVRSACRLPICWRWS